MPRVSAQHRLSRRTEIVVAAARLFAVNGFHATSMADIISASGLSAGGVYRYFRSKDELVAAVAERALSAMDEAFGQLPADTSTLSPEQALAAILGAFTRRLAADPITGVDLTRIGVQVWAEALRSPALAARTEQVYRRRREDLTELARRWQADGRLAADAVPDQVGAAMLSLLQGFVLQRLLLADTDVDGYLTGVRALLAPAAPSPGQDQPPS